MLYRYEQNSHNFKPLKFYKKQAKRSKMCTPAIALLPVSLFTKSIVNVSI